MRQVFNLFSFGMQQIIGIKCQTLINDKSYQKTTYVHASRKMKLEKGDIIILGNRRFEFNS